MSTTQTQHTPGPWKMHKGEGTCFHDGNRVSITAGRGQNTSTVAEVWPTNGCDDDIADGHLIAAAPLLLEALERVAPTLEGVLAALERDTAQRGPNVIYAALDQARHAIRAARGGDHA